MEKTGRSVAAFTKLIIYFTVFVATSCSVSDLHYGNYQGTNSQKIKLLPDSTFTYATPGPMGEPDLLSGTWTRAGSRLMLHARKSEAKKLAPAITVKEAEAAESKLVIAPKIGLNVFIDVLINGAKVGEISGSDSTFIFEGPLNKLELKARATGMYAELFKNDTLYTDAILFSGYTAPILATVTINVALRNFYKVPAENSYLQIMNREKLYWDKKETLFYWEEPTL